MHYLESLEDIYKKIKDKIKLQIYKEFFMIEETNYWEHYQKLDKILDYKFEFNYKNNDDLPLVENININLKVSANCSLLTGQFQVMLKIEQDLKLYKSFKSFIEKPISVLYNAARKEKKIWWL